MQNFVTACKQGGYDGQGSAHKNKAVKKKKTSGGAMDNRLIAHKPPLLLA